MIRRKLAILSNGRQTIWIGIFGFEEGQIPHPPQSLEILVADDPDQGM